MELPVLWSGFISFISVPCKAHLNTYTEDALYKAITISLLTQQRSFCTNLMPHGKEEVMLNEERKKSKQKLAFTRVFCCCYCCFFVLLLLFIYIFYFGGFNEPLGLKDNTNSPTDSQLNISLQLCISLACRALNPTIPVAFITPTNRQGKEATQQDHV